MLDERSLDEVMRTFGLTFHGFKRATGIPSFAPWLVTVCHPNEGRRDRTVRIGDPNRVSKANLNWFTLATELGLLSPERQFLLSLDLSINLDLSKVLADDEPGELVWALVELGEGWDIVGTGSASRVFGWAYGCPGFAMSAVDGSVFAQGTVWQESIGMAFLPKPYCVPTLRALVERNVGKPYRTAEQSEDAIAWLDRGGDCK